MPGQQTVKQEAKMATAEVKRSASGAISARCALPEGAKSATYSSVKCLPSPGLQGAGWEEGTKVKVDQGQTRAQVPVSKKEVPACSYMRLEEAQVMRSITMSKRQNVSPAQGCKGQAGRK